LEGTERHLLEELFEAMPVLRITDPVVDKAIELR